MTADPFDVVILILRIALVFLLYFFIVLVVRTINREFSVASRRSRVAAPAPVYEPEEFRPPVPTATGVAGRLVVTEIGNATTVRPGVVFELGPITPIGRRPNNAIILDDDFVSSEHALLAWREGRWWLSDAGSTNGTTLNNQPIQRPVAVNWGDLIGVGRVRLRLEP